MSETVAKNQKRINSSKRIVTFGEMLLRLSPPDHLRFQQAQSYDAYYGGAEANVAVSLTHLGLPVDYVTRIPHNVLGDGCVEYLRKHGVGTNKIIRGGETGSDYIFWNRAYPTGIVKSFMTGRAPPWIPSGRYCLTGALFLKMPVGIIGRELPRHYLRVPRKPVWNRFNPPKRKG